MIYSFNNGLRQPWTEKSKVYGKYGAGAAAIVLALVWFELIYFAATHHFPKFPTVSFDQHSSSASNVANKTSAKSTTATPATSTTTTAASALPSYVTGGPSSYTNTVDPGTWTVNAPATTTPAVGGLGGGTTVDPGTLVPDSNSGLPVQLPLTTTVPGTSVQAGDKQVIGTSPIGVTLN